MKIWTQEMGIANQIYHW